MGSDNLSRAEVHSPTAQFRLHFRRGSAMANGYFGRVLSGAVGVVGPPGSACVALGANAAQRRRSPRTSRRFSRTSASRATGRIRSRRCRCITYEEARPWARSIRDRVASRNMPPWHIDPTVGIQHYKNDRSLSEKEIDTIVKWAANGAPKGDPKDMPAPVKWDSGQRLELRQAVRRAAGPRHQVAQVHAEGRGDGRLVQAGRRDGRHRAPLGARHRNAPGHASRAARSPITRSPT